MGRMYTAVFEAIAVSAAQDFFEVTAPSDAAVKVHSVYIGQTSDVGDAAEEILDIRLTDYATSGSGGASVTPDAHEDGDAAFGGTVERNNTTQGGTPTIKHADTFNIRTGWQYRPKDTEMHTISPSQILAVELPSAPADALTVSGSITFEEIGG